MLTIHPDIGSAGVSAVLLQVPVNRDVEGNNRRMEDRELILNQRGTSTQAGMPSAARLFDLVWDSLADLMGTATVATLMRRALGRASARRQDLSELKIVKKDLEYTYELPESWQTDCDGEPGKALKDLIAELCPLLVQLTGPVAVRRLERIALLKECNILTAEEVSAWLSRK